MTLEVDCSKIRKILTSIEFLPFRGHPKSQVCGVRIACAIPAMVFPSFAMEAIEKRFPKLVKRPATAASIQVALVGISLLVANPLTCALFPQCAGIGIDRLEDEIRSKGQPGQTVYYNRGL